MAPEAAWVKIGAVVAIPFGTAALRRSNSSRERGPGISVTTRRSCASSIRHLPARRRATRRTRSIQRSDSRSNRQRVSPGEPGRVRARQKHAAGPFCTLRPTRVPESTSPTPSVPLRRMGASRNTCTNRTMLGVPLTVGDLLKTPGLPLKAVSGQQGLDHAIRWVHVSELDDPTPWLKGGELLLVTGMGIGATPARQRAYITRLVETDLAGLGFGLGFSHQRVPKALLEAAEAASFPVFEVPYVLPFIAITEAVFTRLVTEQHDMLSRSMRP